VYCEKHFTNKIDLT